jgi:hypothetical protein
MTEMTKKSSNVTLRKSVILLDYLYSLRSKSVYYKQGYSLENEEI